MNDAQKKNLEQLKQGGKEQYEALRKHHQEGGTFKSYLGTLKDSGISFERPIDDQPYYFLFTAPTPGEYALTVFNKEMVPVQVDDSQITVLLDSLDTLLGHQFQFESLETDAERSVYFAQMLGEIKEHDAIIRSVVIFDDAKTELKQLRSTIQLLQKQILDTNAHVDNEYERGVFNGMETIVASLERREPHYLFPVDELYVSIAEESASTLEGPASDN